jgi:hypothetical protein
LWFFPLLVRRLTKLDQASRRLLLLKKIWQEFNPAENWWRARDKEHMYAWGGGSGELALTLTLHDRDWEGNLFCYINLPLTLFLLLARLYFWFHQVCPSGYRCSGMNTGTEGFLDLKESRKILIFNACFEFPFYGEILNLESDRCASWFSCYFVTGFMETPRRSILEIAFVFIYLFILIWNCCI